MDELRRARRLARRLALATAICCAANSGYADGPAKTSSQSQTLRSLLSQGWAHVEPATESDETCMQGADPSPAVRPPAKEVIPKLPAQPVRSVMTPVITAPAELPTPQAAIVRPNLRVLEVPSGVDSPRELNGSAPDQQAISLPSSLAELIKQRTKPHVVPKQSVDSESISVEFTPSVNRLDVERPITTGVVRLQASESNVRIAEPIQPDASPTQRIDPAATLASIEAEVTENATPDPATSPESAGPTDVADAPPPAESDRPEFDRPVRMEAQAPDENLLSEVDPPEVESTTQVESIASESQTAIQTLAASKPAATDSTITGDAVGATAAGKHGTALSVASDQSRTTAEQNGFSLLPLKSLGAESATTLGESDNRSLTATIHANRLREVARECLRNSQDRLQRRATHSAKKYALEALRSVVAMRDAQSGGNQHARQLKAAFDAIREAEDFCGRFGAIDQSALKRMVDVHETQVLKNRDLENVSALEATETYLAAARTSLVGAAAGEPEGSDALVLLGQIERDISGRGDTHAAAVAVTLQRAAVEIEPTSALGYRELGTTLLHQGLVEQAAWALNKSVEIHPTRIGYQRLLEASRRLGDVDSARVCLASLEDPQLESELPVRTLSPQAFAATHRPDPASFQAKSLKPKPVEAPKAKAPRVSFRSFLPFGRR